MSWYVSFSLLIGLVIVSMGIGIPVAFAFLLTNIIGIFLFFGGQSGIDQMIANFSEAITSYALTPLPLFLLMGSIYFRSGLGEKVIHALDLCIGKLKARLSYVTLGAGTVFSALSGSSLANTGMLGSMMAPEMLKRGYKPYIAYGPILAAGCLAAIIPPSSTAVLLGSLAKINLSALMLAGIIPGLILASLFALIILFQAFFFKDSAPIDSPKHVSFKEKINAIGVNIFPISLIILAVVGTVILGIATPTESAALGCIAVLILTFFYKKISLSLISSSLKDTLNISAITLFIISGSNTFSQVFSFSGASNGLVSLIMQINLEAYILVICMVAIILILGMFMDQVSMMLITIPIFMPIIANTSYDPVWFGIILLLSYEIGFITPPFGLLLFIILGLAPKGTSLKTVTYAAAPYVGVTLMLIGILIAYPDIVLFLPEKVLK